MQTLGIIFLFASTISQNDAFNIVAIESPPYVCTENFPCPPAIMPERQNGNDCMYRGVKTADGQCVHGYIIDLLQVLTSQQNANMSFSLWLTTDMVTGGHSNFVKEIFSPGMLGISFCGNEPCDMAVGDVTINWARRRLPRARFSRPFMTLGHQVLGRTKRMSPGVNFLFLEPFTPSLWLLIIGNLGLLTFAIVFVEYPHFRARFGYFSAKSSQETSWEARSLYR